MRFWLYLSDEILNKWPSAVFSGLLLTCAFPDLNISWLAWFALLPLLWAIKSGDAKEAFRIGLITGLVHFATLLYWITHALHIYGGIPLPVCIPVLLCFAAYLSFYIAFFCVLIVFIGKTPISLFLAAPPLWVVTEFLRAHLFSGFPWELLGYSQYQHLWLIQLSDITGVYGISYVLVLINITFYLLFLHLSKAKWQGHMVGRRTALLAGLVACFIALGVMVYGQQRIQDVKDVCAKSPSIRIAVVQGNIPQDRKWNPKFQIETLDTYLRLSYRASAASPDIIVWPETAAPFYFLFDSRPTNYLVQGIRQLDAELLFGSPTVVMDSKNQYTFFNSAYLLNPQGQVIGRSDKSHLVPFGEYVPFRKWLPFIGSLVDQVGDFNPGPLGSVISWHQFKLGVQICFEMIFPAVSRAAVQNNANILINLTNDAWYGKTSAPYQHFSMAIFRAIENRRSMIRAANTGISGAVSASGEIVSTTPLFMEATRTTEVTIPNLKTFYTSHGDLFVWACWVIVITMGFGQRIRKFRPMEQ